MPSLSSRQANKYKYAGWWFPTLGFALTAHLAAVRRTGEPEGVLNEGLVISALSAPMDSAGGQDAYPMLFDKVSAIGHKIASNQHFQQGNKRTALLLVSATLEWNGYNFNSFNQSAKYMLFSLVGAGYLSREGLKYALILGCGMDPLKHG